MMALGMMLGTMDFLIFPLIIFHYVPASSGAKENNLHRNCWLSVLLIIRCILHEVSFLCAISVHVCAHTHCA